MAENRFRFPLFAYNLLLHDTKVMSIYSSVSTGGSYFGQIKKPLYRWQKCLYRWRLIIIGRVDLHVLMYTGLNVDRFLADYFPL